MLISCGESFQDKAVKFAANDNKIDEQEYKTLAQEIKNSGDAGLRQFIGENGEIDDVKLKDYLVKFFAAKKMPVAANDIWTVATSETAPVSKFNIDVYIENSASMDGYVKGVTEFETATYNLLGNFKTSDFCADLNLNYINNEIPYTKPKALPQDIQDFIERLEPATFQQRGGERGISDLQKILQTVIGKVNDKTAAVLVSDFVFSPGKNKNAQEFLTAQSVGINIDFVEKMKQFDLAAIVLQMQSKFDGKYYDKNDNPLTLAAKRPYYVWIFGSRGQIRTILDRKITDNIKGGYLNRIVFMPVKQSAAPDYKILLRPRIGEFELASGAKGDITEAVVSRETQTKGIFGFNIAVNFSGAIQDKSYFTDAGNYRLSNGKYTLAVEEITDAGDPSLKGYTHKLKLQTTELRDEVLKIELIGKIPSWVESSTSIDDSAIVSDDAEKQKTFGLKYLIEGISDAFYPKTNENITNTINITIRK